MISEDVEKLWRRQRQTTGKLSLPPPRGKPWPNPWGKPPPPLGGGVGFALGDGFGQTQFALP